MKIECTPEELKNLLTSEKSEETDQLADKVIQSLQATLQEVAEWAIDIKKPGIGQTIKLY